MTAVGKAKQMREACTQPSENALVFWCPLLALTLQH